MNLCRLSISFFENSPFKNCSSTFSGDSGKLGYSKKIPMHETRFKFAGLCDYRTRPLEGMKQ
jgi:hypothetical protein